MELHVQDFLKSIYLFNDFIELNHLISIDVIRLDYCAKRIV